MFQPSSIPTEQATTTPDDDATFSDVDRELARQNAALAEALEWLREQGNASLPLDAEIVEQIAELDELVSDTRANGSTSLPHGHSTRC